MVVVPHNTPTKEAAVKGWCSLWRCPHGLLWHVFMTHPISDYQTTNRKDEEAPMADYRTTGSVKGAHCDHTGDIPPAVSFPPLPPTGMTDLPMSEAEFLGRPHPAVVAHTAAVVERVQALTPPSLVKLDRAETALAAVVARRKLEQAGQFQTDQWWDLKRYEDGLVDNYIEATS